MRPQEAIAADAQSLLSPFCGEVPPRPAWFDRALANRPVRARHAVAGAGIETLSWGERGKPGLLFAHGNQAHADWWSFIAPFFLPHYRIAAFSWSGMGGSDWRAHYDLDTLSGEIEAVAQAEGLFEGPCAPIVVSHSFGTFPSLLYAARRGERLKGLVTIDTPILSPAQRAERRRPEPGSAARLRPNNVYPSLEAALARFRFAPPQPCDNPYVADHIARTALKAVDGEDDAAGWTWRFDPFFWRTLRIGDPAANLAAARCPVAVLWGGESRLWDARVVETVRANGRPGMPIIQIPEAHHHVMVDQPLALVAALHALLAAWPGEATPG